VEVNKDTCSAFPLILLSLDVLNGFLCCMHGNLLYSCLTDESRIECSFPCVGVLPQATILVMSTPLVITPGRPTMTPK
jgi:hypothetical protein